MKWKNQQNLLSGYHASNQDAFIQHVFRRRSYVIRINNRLIPATGTSSETVREMTGRDRSLEPPKPDRPPAGNVKSDGPLVAAWSSSLYAAGGATSTSGCPRARGATTWQGHNLQGWRRRDQVLPQGMRGGGGPPHRLRPVHRVREDLRHAQDPPRRVPAAQGAAETQEMNLNSDPSRDP